ncbi:MAG: pyridoxal 5'-phosphate synthase [Acidimicrobiia bacterium]|nr:pyridoxal 5'-phosphate synthase [Acidimicrobiia bacterium]
MEPLDPVRRGRFAEAFRRRRSAPARGRGARDGFRRRRAGGALRAAPRCRQHGGFRFFSDAESPTRGSDLAANDRVALVFAWHAVGRQVRVRGRALPLADAEIDEYWASRPRESRIAAVASNQSCVVEGRRTLEARYAVVAEDAAEGPVERPDRWVGWRVEPTEVEFWQARAHRFHDRLRYRREPDSSEAADWIVERLQP